MARGRNHQAELRVDFQDAARRHWRDAELLFEHERALNADQLYGLAAECALKAILQGLGALDLAKGKPFPGHFGVHANALWDQFMALAEGLYGARYASYLARENAFAGWTVDDRYSADRTLQEGTLESHREAARDACVMLEAAQLDGLLGEEG